ncbi:L-threonylcarbamoyladenylate synthase [Rhodovulum sp. DZ06]|uniref:L-threonylcarbamoyladenylate synthase n=1 Tax=Rhodovulum sp. DZ06 TaxID=3425126 RepID=UPI003D33CC0B
MTAGAERGSGGGTTLRLAADAAGVEAAARILRAGGLVAFPTETVYGLGGDATNPGAAGAIYAAKGRPSFNPLIAHIADPAQAGEWIEMQGPAQALAEAFWPGPLTLVAPLRPGCGIAPAVTAGGARLALRCPAHPVARALLAAAGRPIAAPSANVSGRVSPTTADHVLDGLSGRIDAVLDGGPCAVGVESTILAVEADGTARLLRPGGVSAEDLRMVLGDRLRAADGSPLVEGAEAPGLKAEPGVDPAPEAPGMLSSHYAPGAAVRLNAEAPRPGEGWLGFGPEPEGIEAHDGPRMNLSPPGDPAEAAAALFAALRALDAALGGRGSLAVAPVPEAGLGAAVNDRLRRAAAPRPQ